MRTKTQLTKSRIHPQLTFTDEVIFQNGNLPPHHFTKSGDQTFHKTLKNYKKELLTTAILKAEARKAEGYEAEITHEIIIQSIDEMQKQNYEKVHPKQMTVVQIFEYFFTAVAAAGASNIGKPLGILCFGLGLTFGLGLFVYRINYKKSKFN